MSQLHNYNLPDASGKFGKYGGKYVPETLITPLKELEEIYTSLKNDKTFNEELKLYFILARNLVKKFIENLAVIIDAE